MKQLELMGISPDDWFTPDKIFAEIEAKHGPFDLDAAATEANKKAPRFWSKDDDGLSKPWEGRVWCNPPYQNIIRWVRKAWEEVESGSASKVVMLLPCDTSTAWFHDYALKHGTLEFLRGRIKFGGCQQSSMKPSVLVIFEKQLDARTKEGY